MTSIGSLIRRLRQDKGYSQQYLADQCSINHSTIAKIEVGARYPGIVVTSRLAYALRVDSQQLIRQLVQEKEEQRRQLDRKRTLINSLSSAEVDELLEKVHQRQSDQYSALVHKIGF